MIADIQTGELNGDLVRSLSIKALPTPENGWPPRPFQIVSLLEMIKFRAEVFFVVGVIIAELKTTSESISPQQTFTDVMTAKATKNLRFMRDQCDSVDLRMSVLHMDRFKIDERTTFAAFGHFLRELHERITDELSLGLFMQLPANRATYYADAPQFGDEVVQKFPETTSDIQEAAKCYATGRSTATVFHLMRVVEHAVQYLGKKVGISLVGEKNWHNILDEVDKAVRTMPISSPSQKQSRNRIAESSVHLRMVKDAWRNDVMHPKETYTEEEAERIFRNVKDFMVHLATKL